MSLISVLRSFLQCFSHITTVATAAIANSPLTLSWHRVNQSCFYFLSVQRLPAKYPVSFLFFKMISPGLNSLTLSFDFRVLSQNPNSSVDRTFNTWPFYDSIQNAAHHGCRISKPTHCRSRTYTTSQMWRRTVRYRVHFPSCSLVVAFHAHTLAPSGPRYRKRQD